MEEVWPQVITRAPGLKLDIVGSGNGSWVSDFTHLQGVNFHGRVDSLEPFYDAASLCLIPVFFGSGTRVKVIEAARYARPCLSTAIGVEGLPFEAGVDYLAAESVNDWVDALTELQISHLNQLGKCSREKLAPVYDTRATARTFLRSVMAMEPVSNSSSMDTYECKAAS